MHARNSQKGQLAQRNMPQMRTTFEPPLGQFYMVQTREDSKDGETVHLRQGR